MRTRTDHPLIGKTVRWTHGPNVLEGPATHYDDEDDELFIVPDGLIHGHYWVPARECVEVLADVVEEPRWEYGLRLHANIRHRPGDNRATYTPPTTPHPSLERAREMAALNPGYRPTFHRRRKAGPWVPVKQMPELGTSKHPRRDAWQGTLTREPDGSMPTTIWGCGHWHRTETRAHQCAAHQWPHAKGTP